MSSHRIEARLPFPSAEQAKIALQVLEVDKELRPHLAQRTLTQDASDLVVSYNAVSVRQARVALDHFFSDAELVVETLKELSPDALANAPQLDQKLSKFT